MERRRAVQKHGVLLDDLLEDVPDLGDHRVDHLLGGLDVLDGLALDEPRHDERLEESRAISFGRPHWWIFSSGPATMTERPE